MTARTCNSRARRALVLALIVLAMAVGSVGVAAWYLGIKTKMDLVAYAGMIHDSFNPVWRDLAFRRIRRGDRLDDLLARHTPLRRDDFPPYALLHYGGGFGSLNIAAKDGSLVMAAAASCTWTHVFFETPGLREDLAREYSARIGQRRMDAAMYSVHRAISNRQTVFLASIIGSFPLSPNAWDRVAIMNSLAITIEVTKVVAGNMRVGTRLHIPRGKLDSDDLVSETELVFLHVNDSRILYPRYSGEELYVTVSRSALDRYLTLTAEQIHDMEARCLSQSPELAKCLRLTQDQTKGQPPAGADGPPPAQP